MSRLGLTTAGAARRWGVGERGVANVVAGKQPPGPYIAFIIGLELRWLDLLQLIAGFTGSARERKDDDERG